MHKIAAQKVKMTQIWKGDEVIPVTVLLVQPKESENPFEILKEGDRVRITGTSKGKGHQGVVKRHGFHGGPKTHGQKNRMRMPGSIGSTAPQRVIKGRRMAGHMGMQRVTLRNLLIADIKPEEKLILVKGAVPGMRGTKVEIKK